MALNFSFASKSRQIKFFNLVETEMTKYSALLNEKKNTIKRPAHCKPNTVHTRPKKYLVPKAHKKNNRRLARWCYCIGTNLGAGTLALGAKAPTIWHIGGSAKSKTNLARAQLWYNSNCYLSNSRPAYLSYLSS